MIYLSIYLNFSLSQPLKKEPGTHSQLYRARGAVRAPAPQKFEGDVLRRAFSGARSKHAHVSLPPPQDVLTHPWMKRHAAGTARPPASSLACPGPGLHSAHSFRGAVAGPSIGGGSCSAEAAHASPDGSVSGAGRVAHSSEARDSGASEPGVMPRELDSAAGVSASADGLCGRRGGKWAGESVASARVFFSPENLRLKLKIHGFIDAFKRGPEVHYTHLLSAADADAAGREWDAFCVGLRELNDYLERQGSADGPFFLGGEPSLAEAATAPALFRMVSTLPVLRDLELVTACEEMDLTRLVAWLREILDRPQDVCDVAALPAHVYVALARKLHVRYEGPPTPSAFSPRASFQFGGTPGDSGSLVGYRVGSLLSPGGSARGSFNKGGSAAASRLRLGASVVEADMEYEV